MKRWTDLVRRDPAAYDSLNQLSVLGLDNHPVAPVEGQANPSRDYVLPLALLTAALLWCCIFSGLVCAIRNRRSIGANSADAETLDLTTMGGSTLLAATAMTLASPA